MNDIITIDGGNSGDRQYWADRIRTTWHKTVDGFVRGVVETGKLLIEAKLNLGHGRFLQMIEEDFEFTARTAQMLMKIAEHPILSNTNHGSHLPASWRTLAELATLSPKIVEAKIADGTIHSGMQRNDAYRLKPGHAAAKHKATMTPLNKLKEEKDELEREKADLEEALADAQSQSEFKFDDDVTVEQVVDFLFSKYGDNTMQKIAATILARFKKPRGRPPGSKAKPKPHPGPE